MLFYLKHSVVVVVSGSLFCHVTSQVLVFFLLRRLFLLRVNISIVENSLCNRSCYKLSRENGTSKLRRITRFNQPELP